MTRMHELIKEIEFDCEETFKNINNMVEVNQKRVLDAFKSERIGDFHFSSTDGYGYDDSGRDGIEAIYAQVFGGEDALVRPQLVSGTHAISTTLYGLLRPGDELIYITGEPYDTLHQVIGNSDADTGSLKDYGIDYQHIPLTQDKTVDFDKVKESISDKTKMIAIQRSKGYEDRPSFQIAQIEEMIKFVKEIREDLIVFVDNCYGEFVEDREPLHVGADIIAGSLIKNPGGGLVRSGGYIVGKEDLVMQAANRLTAPGLGKDAGATLHMLQEMFQGFFLAPHVVGESLKGAVFTARLMEKLNIKTTPAFDDKRTDIIQAVTFEDEEKMIQFCQEIQANSPVNSYVAPYPSEMPGYEEKVIMAAGTFIQGASIELSVDGPIKPPYIAFLQGGLTYAHVKLAIVATIEKMYGERFA